MTEATPSLAGHYEGSGGAAVAGGGHQRPTENHLQSSESASTAALLRPNNLQPYSDEESVTSDNINYQVSD